jgi:uncharacterized protein DUF2784
MSLPLRKRSKSLDMEMINVYSLMADVILVTHFLFIVFVLVGQACIVIGYFRSWHWVRQLMFRLCHLLAIAVVIAQAWANRLCPLTLWENALREAVAELPYAETFVQHWVGRLVYYDAPQWLFTVAYSMFGAVVLFSWVWVRPKRRHNSTASG